MSSLPKPLKIFIYAADAAGHLNASVGFAQGLAARGHQIFFLLNSVFAKQYEQFGFKQILLEKTSPVQEEAKNDAKTQKENPFKVLVEMMKQSGLLTNKNSLEKIKAEMENNAFSEDVYQTLVQFDPQIARAIDQEKPDLFILDQIMIPPAVQKSGIPWMSLLSGNPLWLYQSEELPPPCSGFPTTGDRSSWPEFRTVLEQAISQEITQYQNKLNQTCNYEPEQTTASHLCPDSKYLNIYGYPEELDYQDLITIPAKFARVDAFCREIPEPFVLPEEFKVKPGEKLIYVSMGSMGSIDVELMKRIVGVLGQTAHKYIVSKGPLHDEYELPNNCWGEAYLPQTKILGLVDLVITHGGNNTVTETFRFGKPMIVLPLFADQYDNAQRIQEKNYGVRLEAYSFTDEELISAIDRLLADEELNERAKRAAERIAKSNSKEAVSIRIEAIVEKFWSMKNAKK